MIGCVFGSQSTMVINEGSDVTHFNEVGDEVLTLGLSDSEAF